MVGEKNLIPNPADLAITENQDEPGVAKEKEEFVSKSDFEQMKAELPEEMRILAQSYSMQAEDRLKKRIGADLQSLENTVKMQKEMGVEVAPEKIQEMRNKIISTAYLEDVDGKASKQGSQGESLPAAPNAEVETPEDRELRKVQEQTLSEARGMAQMAGFTIAETDKEMEDLAPYLQAGVSPENFKGAFAKALKAKGARLQTLGIAKNPNAIPGGAVANPDLMKEYQTKKKELPRGNVKAHHKLRREYGEKGLKDI